MLHQFFGHMQHKLEQMKQLQYNEKVKIALEQSMNVRMEIGSISLFLFQPRH